MASILPYSLEEIYELVDAVERNNMEDVKDELGDLLFHVVFLRATGRGNRTF